MATKAKESLRRKIRALTIFSNSSRLSEPAAPGDVLEVDARYAEELIAGGLAEEIDAEEIDAEPADADAEDISSLADAHSKDDLMERAQALDIDGRSSMNKRELAEAIVQAQQ